MDPDGPHRSSGVRSCNRPSGQQHAALSLSAGIYSLSIAIRPFVVPGLRLHVLCCVGAGARIKRVECDEDGGQFKAPFKKYRVILDKDGGAIRFKITL